MPQKKVKLCYRYSYFWLIFWVILFFPIALTLLITGSNFELTHKEYRIEYNGSRFWLCFWVIVFFPVAFLLFFLNGFSLGMHEQQPEPILN
ncbi:MAG: hypothetical protein WB791_07060 [Waddliaceae bacterium]